MTPDCQTCQAAPFRRGLCQRCYEAWRHARAPQCSALGCERKAHARGLCERDYKRFKAYGSTERRVVTWPDVVEQAAEIVNSYSIPVTLRQVFYRLVSVQKLPNTRAAYNQLSSLTADARREGSFPRLAETGRSMRVLAMWPGPASAVRSLLHDYHRDRTVGQASTLVLGVEKNALAGLMASWFAKLGIPVVPLGGYSSETIERKVREGVVEIYDRPARLIYAGDFDASGEDIGRNFIAKAGIDWESTVRVALSADQVTEMDLPINEGKTGDPRTKQFLSKHPEIHARAALGKGVPVQVELDAVEPLALKQLYQDAIDQFWDEDAYQASLAREVKDQDRLTWLSEIAEDWERWENWRMSA